MALGQLTLSIGTTTLTVGTNTAYPFASGGYSRSAVEDLATVGYTQFGNAGIQGWLAYPRHTWTITIICRFAAIAELKAIWAQSDKARRTAPYTGYEINLIDEVEPLFEDEAVATRTAQGDITTRGDGVLQYYAHFKCAIATFDVEKPDGYYRAILTLNELGDA